MFLKLLIIIFIFVEFCIKFCLISMRSVLIISPTAEIVQILFKLYNKNDGAWKAVAIRDVAYGKHVCHHNNSTCILFL